MSTFGGIILTNKGRNLQSKAQAGITLEYTRVGVGDGKLGSSSILGLNKLINEIKSLDIVSLNAKDGIAKVGSVLSNQDITQGFYFRELGIYANDPDLGEILYCYGNAGELAEYISPGGGSDIIEKSIEIHTTVGNAENVSAVIDESLVFASVQALNELENKIGQLNDLTTTEKSNIVAAINEIKSNTGKLDDLTTEDKTNLVASINEIRRTLSGHQAESATQFQRQASRINRLSRHNTAQDKELAFLKLKQEADDRIENGTTFAEDMVGNRFGMEFNESESENIVIRDGAMIMAESTQETVTVEDATVVNEAYDTSGNGGRKLVRLDNGWLVAGAKDTANEIIKIRVMKDGQTFEESDLTYINKSGVGDFSLRSIGTRVYVLYGDTTQVYSVDFDATNVDNTNQNANKTQVEETQHGIGKVSLAINPEGTELHAAWSSKNSTYPNSFNIRYAKGVISEIDGSVTWGEVDQVSTHNSSNYNHKNPSIVIGDNDYPIIIEEYSFGDRYRISSFNFNGESWGINSIYDGATYTQSSPSAIFVPSEINGLPQGRIWVAWHGRDETDNSSENIRISYSDDGGVSWSNMEKLTSGSLNRRNASITANKNNEIFIIYEDPSFQLNFDIAKLENTNNVWSNPIPIVNKEGLQHMPSTLFDLSLDFSEPIFIYQDNENNKVGFYGTWTEGTETPTIEATAVYELPSTDYVGAFVQREGDVNIDAYINDVQMDSDLENGEYMFTKELDSEAPVKLRLELSRVDTSGGNDDQVTRILGGIA